LPDRQEQAASVIACVDTALLVIPEKTAHLISNAIRRCTRRWRSDPDHRKELQRQKKVAELRKPRLALDLKSKPELGENVIRASLESSRPRKWIAALHAWR